MVQIEAAPEQGIPISRVPDADLYLGDFMTERELELLHGMDQPIDHGFLWRDVDILEASRDEDFLRYRSALAQDTFRARVVCERGVERALQPFRRHAFLRRHDGRMNHEHRIRRTITLMRRDENRNGYRT